PLIQPPRQPSSAGQAPWSATSPSRRTMPFVADHERRAIGPPLPSRERESEQLRDAPGYGLLGHGPPTGGTGGPWRDVADHGRCAPTWEIAGSPDSQGGSGFFLGEVGHVAPWSATSSSWRTMAFVADYEGTRRGRASALVRS